MQAQKRRGLTLPTSLVRFVLFFAAEALSALILTANMRAAVVASYAGLAVTDGAWAAQLFLMAKWMNEDAASRSYAALAGCVLGAAVGSCVSLYLTRHLFV